MVGTPLNTKKQTIIGTTHADFEFGQILFGGGWLGLCNTLVALLYWSFRWDAIRKLENHY